MRTVLMLVAALAIAAFDGSHGIGGSSAGPAFARGTAAILPEAKAIDVTKQCSRSAPTPEGAWLPTPAEVVAFEPALAKFLSEKFAEAADGTPANVGGYYRQYAGIIVGGKKLVYINGFPGSVAKEMSEGKDWRTEPVMVCDGGPAFFGAEYDMESHEFLHLSFNGIA